MFQVDGTSISLHRGDTGAIKLTALATLPDGTSFTFGEDDVAVFTIKANGGTIVKEKIAHLTNNSFVVVFYNQDTDRLSPGTYSWDVRYVINPYYEDETQQRVVSGDQVLTPNNPMQMNRLTVVSEI